MELVKVTKEVLEDAQSKGYTAIVTQHNSNPLEPIWIFEKVKEDKLSQFEEDLHSSFQVCYAIADALKTIDEHPFIGKVNLLSSKGVHADKSAIDD